MNLRSGVSRLAAVLLGVLASACTVTNDTSSNEPDPVGTCSTDFVHVSCASPSMGYSCTGTAAPSATDPSLTCGAGLADAFGDTLYCCVTPTTAACAVDSSVVGCPATQTGYSCTGADAPSQSIASLACGAGAAGASGKTSYCCVASATADTCSADGGVTGCTGAATGFSCTGSDTPSKSDPALVCGPGAAGPEGTTRYCCSTSATAGACTSDGTVTGCSGAATGYRCTGIDAPTKEDASLACGPGSGGTEGTTTYCCSSATAPGACASDGAVSGCTGAASGYSCTGTGTPTDSNSALTCSTAVANVSGKTDYCCAPSAGVCSADAAVTGCTGAATGYSCTGTDAPNSGGSALLCTNGVAGAGGKTEYCCSL